MKKVPPGEAAHFFSACALSEKQVPQTKTHDPEKWEPVFGNDHASQQTLNERPWL